ncbi:MAG: four helix bundle protein [Chloroflexi bacterium]|nr:four helix bundle protein [Chloroflexota bacterium]
MEKTNGLNRRLSIGRVIRPIIFDLIGIVITIALLSPGGIIFRFEDLRIYHKALDYIDWVYLMAKNTTDDPFMKLFFDRFLTSANGIALNIAEGSSRNKSQFVYY